MLDTEGFELDVEKMIAHASKDQVGNLFLKLSDGHRFLAGDEVELRGMLERHFMDKLCSPPQPNRSADVLHD